MHSRHITWIHNTHNMKCSHSTICWIAIIICYSHLCSKTISSSLWWKNIILFEICWNVDSAKMSFAPSTNLHITQLLWCSHFKQIYVKPERANIWLVISICKYIQLEPVLMPHCEFNLNIIVFPWTITEIKIIIELNTKSKVCTNFVDS